MPHTGREARLGSILRTMGEVARDWAADDLGFTLARRLAAGNRGRLADVGPQALDWLRERVTYTREEPEVVVGLGPLLDLGAGDCDDQACALASLLLPLAWHCYWAVGWRAGAPVHVWLVGLPPDGGEPIDLDPTIPGPAGSSPLRIGGLDGATLHTLDGRRRVAVAWAA